VCATWGNDPHCDHEAADLMARALAARAGLRHIAYPVWGWTLPPDADIPNGAVRGWRLDITQALAAKQSAIAAHRSQHSVAPDGFSAGFALPDELLRVAAQPFEVFLAP
jgi:LmbE family N-acetylglucosaminyl deacetylase